MKNSASSSAPGRKSPPVEPAHRSFALAGPTVPLDPRLNAVRRDLADIRLAEYVFAPHYAAPLAMMVRRRVDLLDGPGDNAVVLTTCAVGERFEALDFASGLAWGVSSAAGLVGYVALDALECMTD